MAKNGKRIPMVRKIDANAGARKVASALNMVLEVLRIANLLKVSWICYSDPVKL